MAAPGVGSSTKRSDPQENCSSNANGKSNTLMLPYQLFIRYFTTLNTVVVSISFIRKYILKYSRPRGIIIADPMRCGWLSPSPLITVSGFQIFSGILLRQYYSPKMAAVPPKLERPVTLPDPSSSKNKDET